jgi:hypothetical protein
MSTLRGASVRETTLKPSPGEKNMRHNVHKYEKKVPRPKYYYCTIRILIPTTYEVRRKFRLVGLHKYPLMRLAGVH